jgi:beta-galactosidase
MKLKFTHLIITIGILFFSIINGSSQSIYVGANYHPHDDKNPEKIKKDIEMMKAAGFTCVRMGHLEWDSYQPAEGKFNFGVCRAGGQIPGKFEIYWISNISDKS